MPEKDFATLIRAFAIVRKTFRCKLMIIGDTQRSPTYMSSLRALVEQLDLQSEVDFVGFTTNPFAYLAKCEAYALSSLYEGLPGALVQAMALGCKIVSADCRSGPREILKSGEYGHLVPVGNYVEMAHALTLALREKHDRSLGRKRTEEFTEERALNSLLSLVHRLQSQPKR